MPGENLTRIEAQERRAVVDTHEYDVVLDLTRGSEVFGSTTTVRFSATEGADTFIDLIAREVRSITLNGRELDPALMPAFLSGDREDMLTAREREILQLLADGMSNADVAGRLFISQETVKSHVRHILTKLEADTRTHAVAIALREAIID